LEEHFNIVLVVMWRNEEW